MRSKEVTRYSSGSKWLHWLIALSVIIMLIVGFFLDAVPAQFKGTAYMMHKSIGITILFLMIFRFIWVHASGRPSLSASINYWEKALAYFVQYSFYFLLLLMPLSGWIMSLAEERVPVYFNLFKAPLPGIGPNKALANFMDKTHYILAWIIITFIVLHIAGALKHHFIDKDNVLKRMWF